MYSIYVIICIFFCVYVYCMYVLYCFCIDLYAIVCVFCFPFERNYFNIDLLYIICYYRYIFCIYSTISLHYMPPLHVVLFVYSVGSLNFKPLTMPYFIISSLLHIRQLYVIGGNRLKAVTRPITTAKGTPSPFSVIIIAHTANLADCHHATYYYQYMLQTKRADGARGRDLPKGNHRASPRQTRSSLWLHSHQLFAFSPQKTVFR